MILNIQMFSLINLKMKSYSDYKIRKNLNESSICMKLVKKMHVFLRC